VACTRATPPDVLPPLPPGATPLHYAGEGSTSLNLCLADAAQSLRPAYRHFGAASPGQARLPVTATWGAVIAHYDRALAGWHVVRRPAEQGASTSCLLREWVTGRWFWEQRFAVVLVDRTGHYGGPYRDEAGPLKALYIVVPSPDRS
jgi:hypothetical protein